VRAVVTVPPDESLARELTRLAEEGQLSAAVERARASDVRACVFSVEPAEPYDDTEAQAAGMTLTRELLQLRRLLPLPDEPDIIASRGLAVRAFRVGRDEQPWLDVNNRAFAWHPDQGGWTLDDLRSRMAEPWFDPEGFLVHDASDGTMDGFCWTKVHTGTDPPMGEIYVIAADPDRAEKGLGHRLAVAGLDHLAHKGMTTAMLYVEADNARARALYDRLGFTTHHAKRWWQVDLDGLS
jgi:mycothiol synthase